MKKKIYIILFIISTLLLLSCLFFRSTYYKFNSSKVKETTSYLSGEDFKGRLPGSFENNKVSYEISDTFKSFNLKPLSDDYLEEFKVIAPIQNDYNEHLKILNKDGSVFKEFILGKDFKEDFLNFKVNKIQFSKEDKIHIYDKSILICKDNRLYLFYVTFDKDFLFRSSFISDSQFDFAIQITTDTFNSILDLIRDGYILDVQLPYTLEETSVYNVVGVIEGTSSKLPPLIITSHFDHIGTDSLGRTYYGALDNASGVSFMLELSKTFSSMKFPKRDIIFVALNCEEFGLLGSNEFSIKYSSKLKGATIINLDMIGSPNIPMTFMSGADSVNKESKILNDLSSICKEKNLQYKISYEDSSDHVSFIKNGFDSLTICHEDTSNIHTPKDTEDNISTDSIDNVYNLISSEIVDYCYYENLMLLYDKDTLIILSIITVTLGARTFILIKKSSENI